MVMGMNAGNQGLDENRGRDLYRRVLERLDGVPGVASATLSTACRSSRADFRERRFVTIKTSKIRATAG